MPYITQVQRDALAKRPPASPGELNYLITKLVLEYARNNYGKLSRLSYQSINDVLGALEGLVLETLLLSPIAVAVLVYLSWQGSSALVSGDLVDLGWLMLAGPLTALPLLLFAAGARRIPLTTLGVLQYISPSLQFALGIWIFHEVFEPTRLVGFALIWMSLGLYSVDSWRTARRNTDLAQSSV